MAEKIELSEQDVMDNKLLNEAIAYAVAQHSEGLRKGTTMPYIIMDTRNWTRP